jgi:hypothetical protein
MKKIFLIILAFSLCSFIYAQDDIDENIVYDVFASGTCNFDTDEIGNFKQDFITVKQEGNVFYWGEDNIFTVYNKNIRHSGFMTVITYDFIDKYKQRGILIYQNNRNSDWSTKYMFYIHYEGIAEGEVYCSNKPKIYN